MDSLGRRNQGCLNMVVDYIGQELERREGCALNYDEWQLQHVEDLPQQSNGFDCGVFALKYADCVAQDACINFRPNHADRIW